jgi:hypothetical protein
MEENKINLLKNNDKRTDSDLEWVDEFYRFLQGEIPDGISLSRGYKPKLSPKKAFAIIWYLQEQFPVIPDNINRCDNCGDLFDGNSEGLYWETKGKHYCGGCNHLVPANYDRGKK